MHARVHVPVCIDLNALITSNDLTSCIRSINVIGVLVCLVQRVKAMGIIRVMMTTVKVRSTSAVITAIHHTWLSGGSPQGCCKEAGSGVVCYCHSPHMQC